MIEWKVMNLVTKAAITLKTKKSAEAWYDLVRVGRLVRVDHKNHCETIVEQKGV